MGGLEGGEGGSFETRESQWCVLELCICTSQVYILNMEVYACEVAIGIL